MSRTHFAKQNTFNLVFWTGLIEIRVPHGALYMSCCGVVHLDHTYSESNAGICFGMNAAATLATARYLAYINDDMYVCPGWDTPLYEAIQRENDNRFLFGAALIEPKDTHNPCVIFSSRFGDSLETFKEQDLIATLCL